MPKPPTCLKCGTEHWSGQPCPADKAKKAAKSRPAQRSAAPNVTKLVTSGPEPDDNVTKRVTALEARMAKLEAQVERMRPKTAAERKRAERDRKKAERAQEEQGDG